MTIPSDRGIALPLPNISLRNLDLNASELTDLAAKASDLVARRKIEAEARPSSYLARRA